ncbi:MAG: CUB domain-containing protein [Flavobacteriales bacterium]|nr:CUB domain-containing protein [Flavobacteriales bacterium]
MKRLSLVLVLTFSSAVNAQLLPEFNMTDTTVTICKGILLDSEEGPGSNIYGNNEDFTFTIDAGSTITLTFEPTFCLEQGLDILTFHDGPSIASPQIGPAYTGIVAPPPIVASSGQLTIHFVSDENVAYCGFEAQWTSVALPPVPPVMSVPTAPLCAVNVINLAFSYPIPCDSISPGAFAITGANSPVVTSATPTNCVGGETSTMQLGIDPAFDRNCPYDIAFTIGLRDRCDSLWYFTITASTQITTCPLGVLMELSEDTIARIVHTALRRCAGLSHLHLRMGQRYHRWRRSAQCLSDHHHHLQCHGGGERHGANRHRKCDGRSVRSPGNRTFLGDLPIGRSVRSDRHPSRWILERAGHPGHLVGHFGSRHRRARSSYHPLHAPGRLQ